MTLSIRHDWTTEEIQTLLELPLMELLWQAQTVHREANPGYRVQLASLLSVKTGGCEEDCAYCSQSIHNSSDVTAFEAQMQVEPVLQRARAAKEAGADRFCMGWAWREIRDGAPFEAMLAMVRGVRDLGMELGKKIQLDMHGQDTELDRQVLDLIKDPLTHMVRNSADHGLEMPDARRAAGKSETGHVRLNAFHEGGHIIITVADDGKGLSTEGIRRKAVEKGLVSEAEAVALTQA